MRSILFFIRLALFALLSALCSSKQSDEDFLKRIMYPCSPNFKYRSKECAERGLSEGNVVGYPRFEVVDRCTVADRNLRGMEYICRDRFFTGEPMMKYKTEYLDKPSGRGAGGDAFFDIGKYTHQWVVCEYATEMNAICQPLTATSMYDFETWITYTERVDSYPQIDGSNSRKPWFQPGWKSDMYANYIDRAVLHDYIAEDPHVDVVHEYIKNDAGEKKQWIVAKCAANYTGTGARILADDLSDYTLQWLKQDYTHPLIFKLDLVKWVAENTDCQPE